MEWDVNKKLKGFLFDEMNFIFLHPLKAEPSISFALKPIP